MSNMVSSCLLTMMLSLPAAAPPGLAPLLLASCARSANARFVVLSRTSSLSAIDRLCHASRCISRRLSFSLSLSLSVSQTTFVQVLDSSRHHVERGNSNPEVGLSAQVLDSSRHHVERGNSNPEVRDGRQVEQSVVNRATTEVRSYSEETDLNVLVFLQVLFVSLMALRVASIVVLRGFYSFGVTVLRATYKQCYLFVLPKWFRKWRRKVRFIPYLDVSGTRVIPRDSDSIAARVLGGTPEALDDIVDLNYTDREHCYDDQGEELYLVSLEEAAEEIANDPNWDVSVEQAIEQARQAQQHASTSSHDDRRIEIGALNHRDLEHYDADQGEHLFRVSLEETAEEIAEDLSWEVAVDLAIQQARRAQQDASTSSDDDFIVTATGEEECTEFQAESDIAELTTICSAGHHNATWGGRNPKQVLSWQPVEFPVIIVLLLRLVTILCRKAFWCKDRSQPDDDMEDVFCEIWIIPQDGDSIAARVFGGESPEAFQEMVACNRDFQQELEEQGEKLHLVSLEEAAEEIARDPNWEVSIEQAIEQARQAQQNPSTSSDNDRRKVHFPHDVMCPIIHIVWKDEDSIAARVFGGSSEALDEIQNLNDTDRERCYDEQGEELYLVSLEEAAEEIARDPNWEVSIEQAIEQARQAQQDASTSSDDRRKVHFPPELISETTIIPRDSDSIAARVFGGTPEALQEIRTLNKAIERELAGQGTYLFRVSLEEAADEISNDPSWDVSVKQAIEQARQAQEDASTSSDEAVPMEIDDDIGWGVSAEQAIEQSHQAQQDAATSSGDPVPMEIDDDISCDISVEETIEHAPHQDSDDDFVVTATQEEEEEDQDSDDDFVVTVTQEEEEEDQDSDDDFVVTAHEEEKYQEEKESNVAELERNEEAVQKPTMIVLRRSARHLGKDGEWLQGSTFLEHQGARGSMTIGGRRRSCRLASIIT